jgi:hypothetical protein
MKTQNMKTTFIKLLVLFVALTSCSEVQQEEQQQPIELDLQLDKYPELSTLPNLLKKEINNRVEKSFNMYLEKFGRAKNNYYKSCVYCYFTDAPEEYKQLLDYCVKNYHQTMLLLLKSYFSKEGELPKPHTHMVIRGVYYKAFPDSYKEMLERHDVDIADEAICRWDLRQYEQETEKEAQIPFEELISAIMEKY